MKGSKHRQKRRRLGEGTFLNYPPSTTSSSSEITISSGVIRKAKQSRKSGKMLSRFLIFLNEFQCQLSVAKATQTLRMPVHKSGNFR
jgi:hypothetical protein